MATSLQEMIVDKVKSHIAKALATILYRVEEAVEQLLGAATLNALVRIRTVVYNTIEHVIIEQIRTAVPGDQINKHGDQRAKLAK